MTEYTLYAFGMNMLYFAVTLIVVWLALKFLDRSLNVSFGRDVWSVMKTDPMSLAVYHGARFVGVCLLASAFLR
jgi:hypothetical protein